MELELCSVAFVLPLFPCCYLVFMLIRLNYKRIVEICVKTDERSNCGFL